MTAIPIMRAAHLLLYVEVLREIGAPVDRDLASSRLPAWIAETPDAYVSVPLVLDWIAQCGRDVPAAELGFLAARRSSLATLDAKVRNAVLTAPTTFSRIEALSRMAYREDSAASLRVLQEGPYLRIICDMPGFRGAPFYGYAEWLNLQAIASLVGASAGPEWRPVEMTFVSRSRQCDAAANAFGNTRILAGQPLSSILVPPQVLALPDARPQEVGDAQPMLAETAEDRDFIATLRSVLRPYLGGSTPTLALAAEIAGMSGRTFQRRLADCDRSYSQVLEDVRFEIARDLLVAPGTRIIEVAMASGYESPQNFSRAFRRISGMSPKAYRRMAVVEGA